MPYITEEYHPIAKRSSALFHLLWCGIIITLISSCNSKNQQLSKTSKDLIDTVDYIYNHNAEKGIRYMDSVIAVRKNVSVKDRFDYYGLHHYYNYKALHNYEMASIYADSMRLILETTGNEKKYAKLYGMAAFGKGDALFALNRYPEAYQYYYKGKLIARNNFDNCTLGDYSYHMGMIMYKQGHYELAASHFRQSFDENNSCADEFKRFYRAQELLDNVALSYHKADIIDSAEIYYDKAQSYIDQHAVRFKENTRLIEMARGVIYGNQANLYILKHQLSKAEGMLKKSIVINLKPNYDNKDAELSELKLAHLYADLSQTDSLVGLLKNIRIQLDTVKNSEAEMDWNHLMAGYYQYKNQPEKAIAHFNAYDAIKDSLNKATQKLKENNVTQQFKDFENQSTINNLKSDNQLQQTYLIIALIYAVMALVIIMLIFSNWKRSKNNVKTLSELNVTVTEQKHQLEQSLTELELNGKEKDRILRAVSHDLRNPIGGIASLTALMLMEPGLDAEQVELLQLIQSTTNNSLELINEILEATGVLSAKTVNKQYVDINVLLSHSVELLRFKAAEKNQKIMLHVLEAPEELYISREKIWRVFSNLISNAIKFSPQGAVITAKVTIEKGDIQIAVNDHGIGIPNEIKGEVFQMFTEAKRPGTAGEKSFGLGLSISKQIIESHNGEIWFDSDPIEGTTFYVRLKKETA